MTSEFLSYENTAATRSSFIARRLIELATSGYIDRDCTIDPAEGNVVVGKEIQGFHLEEWAPLCSRKNAELRLTIMGTGEVFGAYTCQHGGAKLLVKVYFSNDSPEKMQCSFFLSMD